MSVTRRSFFTRVGAIATAQGLALKAQQRPPVVDPGATPQDPRMGTGNVEKLFQYSDRRANVSLIKGDNRRNNIYEALVAIDDQIRPGLKARKYVLIKPNGLDPSRQLISTQAHTVHGILDYLAPRFEGPVVVAECGGSPSKQATSEFGWSKIFAEHKLLGAPLSPPPGQNRPWGESEKRKFHVGIRAGNYNMYLAVQRMIHNWGVGIVDAFEGMEGNGPVSGTPVPHRIALASTDFLAVDRVGLECMGIDASWPGYLNYAYQGDLGQYDLAKIDVAGAKIADVQRKYRLHADVDRMLEWRGPMRDLPPNLGYNRRPQQEDLSAYA